MPLKNPFSSNLGGRPNLFFGRKDILNSFWQALNDPGSPYRTNLIGGPHGIGKTALLEQFSQIAKKAGWTVIDVAGKDAYSSFMTGMDTLPKIGTGSPSAGPDLLITIDDVQSIPSYDLTIICDAVQMASRKGQNIILAAAGIPGKWEQALTKEGCSYLKKANRITLNLLSRNEVEEAFTKSFTQAGFVIPNDEAFDLIISLTKGQPYMAQLLGWHAVSGSTGFIIDKNIILQAFQSALADFNHRLLESISSELTKGQLAYLDAMLACMRESHEAQSTAISDILGKSPSQTSMVRKSLLDSGMIIAPTRGYLRFNIPYLREYLSSFSSGSQKAQQLARDWDV